MTITRALLLLVYLHKCHGGHGVSVEEHRDLQSFTTYDFDAAAAYSFDFNGTVQDINPSEADADELIRLTEIFYTREVASAYSLHYQRVSLALESYIWEPSTNFLEVDFAISVTFRPRDDPPPSVDDVLALLNIYNKGTYVRNFLSLATPQDLFSW